MALIEQLGEMKQKENLKQFKFLQIEHFEDWEDLMKEIGQEYFVEAVNVGLEAIARKRIRFDKDTRLTNPQVVVIQRMKDLVAGGVFTQEQALTILIDQNGFDPELARKNLIEGAE